MSTLLHLFFGRVQFQREDKGGYIIIAVIEHSHFVFDEVETI
jgi:hypothetical protein